MSKIYDGRQAVAFAGMKVTVETIVLKPLRRKPISHLAQLLLSAQSRRKQN